MSILTGYIERNFPHRITNTQSSSKSGCKKTKTRPVEYPWWGVLAAISQATNGSLAFGQGWEAYAKRYGTTAGDSMVENFMVGAVFPSILRQDPRYYQSGQGSFFRRIGYSGSRIFVTHTDSGRAQFNYSEIFGAATAAAISSYTYHPRSAYISTPSNPHMFVASERTFSNVGSTWATQVGLDTITIVVKEFWPDNPPQDIEDEQSGHRPSGGRRHSMIDQTQQDLNGTAIPI